MTRDGLVERNETTGEEARVSQRGQDFQLRSAQTPGEVPSGDARRDVSFRQSGSVRQTIADNAGRDHSRRQQPPADTLRDNGAATESQYNSDGADGTFTAPPLHSSEAPTNVMLENTPFTWDSQREDGHPADHEPRRPDRRSEDNNRYTNDDRPAEPPSHHDMPDEPIGAPTSDAPRPADYRPDTGRKPHSGERAERLRFGDTEAAPRGPKVRQHGTQYQRRFTGDAAKDKASDAPSGADSGAPRKKSRLEFTQDEQPPGTDAPNKKVDKARQKAEKSAAKLEKAREKLPTRRRARMEKEFDPEKGKVVRKLRFEEEVKSQRAHVKGPLPLRPVKAGANFAIGYGHKKIHEVEHENVGTEAAHKGELLAEGGLRRAYHLHKTRPYRRVAKLQKTATKRAVNQAYQKALAENPKLKSNLLSRMMQKRKIKRQYAKAAREAKRAGKTIQKAGNVTAKIARAIAGLIRRHPVVFGVLALILLLMFLIMGFFSSCSNMASGGLSSILASSYLAEDADIDNAELSYTEWETDLQMEIVNAEATHPGFDEYRYSVDDIGHNPYELMAFLTSAYQNFTYAEVEAVLREIFAEQYTLEFVEEVEVRYRTETHTDPDTGESYDVEVPYNWYILNINLTARSFSDVIAPRLDSDQREIYNLLMITKGNRQYLTNPFDFNWLPYVSSYYGWRVHPISGAKDYHMGIDIAVAEGTEIRAGHDGVVSTAGNAGDYGLVIVLDDGKGLVSKYAHCSELLVSAGQEVKKGDVIAKVGNTGNSTGPHLHLEIIKDGQYLNPAYFAETGDDGTGTLPPGSPGGPVIPDYPGEPMGDGDYAALMEEAMLHLGKPYVFGASGPDTFDCSGFVSYVLSHSIRPGFGRLGAQGIYNQCTPVSAEGAQPGDLIFFQGTYSTSSTVTHIGIYIGNGQMIHAGKPVQYASINTNYWQEHFYAFARLP